VAWLNVNRQAIETIFPSHCEKQSIPIGEVRMAPVIIDIGASSPRYSGIEKIVRSFDLPFGRVRA
jgi:hypothetical protein